MQIDLSPFFRFRGCAPRLRCAHGSWRGGCRSGDGFSSVDCDVIVGFSGARVLLIHEISGMVRTWFGEMADIEVGTFWGVALGGRSKRESFPKDSLKENGTFGRGSRTMRHRFKVRVSMEVRLLLVDGGEDMELL